MSLIRFWNDFAPRHGSPHIHPKDADLILKKGRSVLDLPYANFRQFVRSERFGDFKDRRFHLSLLPVPYAGDLRKADIFILLLNPGFNFVDHYAEYEASQFRARLLQNLRQKNHDAKFPFLYLDPNYCWHSGFMWWERKFREVGKILAEQKYQGSCLAALKELSQRVAAIELVPYHSTSFADHKLVEQGLPSSVAAQNFVKANLLPRAAAGKATIIVTRRPHDWGLAPMRKHRGVICYRGGLTRGASLGPRTLGGQAILKRLGLNAS